VFKIVPEAKSTQKRCKCQKEEPTLLYLSLWFRFEESARVVLL
jgi:hypothetical protein